VSPEGKSSTLIDAGLDWSAAGMGHKMKRETLVGLAVKLPACVDARRHAAGTPRWPDFCRALLGHPVDVARKCAPTYVKAHKKDNRGDERIAETATRCASSN
jgi:hypothetical protein